MSAPLTLRIGDTVTNISGAMLPARVIKEVLRVGFAAVNADQDILDDLFHKLDAVALASVKTYYSEHTVTVRSNFPTDDFTWPIVSVLDGADEEAPELSPLGEYFGDAIDAAGTTVTRVHGHTCRSVAEIYCLAGGDANAASYLYLVAKAILVTYLDTLMVNGLLDIRMSGRDVQLREDMFPEFTFARLLSMSFTNTFSVRVTERIAKTFVVRLFTEPPQSVTKTEVTAAED